jgi:NitT/TauT family transport system substrate-binding protein
MRAVDLTHPHQDVIIRLSRRGFLGRGIRFSIAIAGGSAFAAGSTLLAPAAQAKGPVKFTHGTGLCNMPLFYAAEKQLFRKHGVEAEVVLTVPGTSTIQVATGKVEMGVIPYTNAIAAYTRSPSFAVVSGSGIQGLIVVAKPGIKNFQDLRGKKVGTFQADTLDIILYDYMKKHGMTYNDIQMQYMGDTFELTNAFIAGQLDAISVIEPYATKARTVTSGNTLGDGTDIYGTGYPDCTLVGQKDFIAKEPELVKNVIRTFFEAEYEIENNFEEAAQATIGKYYKTDMASLLAAAKAQPPGIDIRDKRDFMYSRAQSMKELNYISKDPDKDFVNFKLLEEVIKESPELWRRVKVHAKAS